MQETDRNSVQLFDKMMIARLELYFIIIEYSKKAIMQGVRVYNIINGVFYTLYGLWGLVMPQRILSFFDIETYGVYALHNIRAMWAVCAVMGALILWKARSTSVVMVCMIMALVVGSFAVGRLVGLTFDGMDAGSEATYYEIAFELFWMVAGLFLAKRATTSQST